MYASLAQSQKSIGGSLTSRFFSSGRETSKDKETKDAKAPKEEEPEPTLSQFDPKQHLHESLTQRAALLPTRIQKAMHKISIGDQLSVVAICTLLTTLLAAPYVMQAIQNAEADIFDENELLAVSEDPVDDFTKLARQGWSSQHDDNAILEDPLERMVAEVLQSSQPLQEAARRFVVQILESPQVQAALHRLIQQLWTQLVTDPETAAQVAHLLTIALQDNRVQDSVRQLVLQLLQDEAIVDALHQLVQNLGTDDAVAQAVQNLLTTAAHESLDDPILLDHSRMFASDIVGDDGVQRTAREALWHLLFGVNNTTMTKFSHVWDHDYYSALWTVVGVGLVVVGVWQLGNVPLALLETDAIWNGMRTIAAWPGQWLSTLTATTTTTSNAGTRSMGTGSSWKLPTRGWSSWWNESMVAHCLALPGIWLSQMQDWILGSLRWRPQSRGPGRAPLPAGFGHFYETIWETTCRWSWAATQWTGRNLWHVTTSAVQQSLHAARLALGALQRGTQTVEGWLGRLAAAGWATFGRWSRRAGTASVGFLQRAGQNATAALGRSIDWIWNRILGLRRTETSSATG